MKAGMTSSTPSGFTGNLDFKRLRAAMESMPPPPRFTEALLSKRHAEKLCVAAGEPRRVEPGDRVTIAGFNLRVIPDNLAPRRPRLKISDDFPYCSAEFRAEWNAWALERFGTEEVCYVMDSSVLKELQAGIACNIERRIVKVLVGDFG